MFFVLFLNLLFLHAAMPETPTEKLDKTFADLEMHNISIDASVCTDETALPRHVEDVRIALLDFTDASIPSYMVQQMVGRLVATSAGQAETSDLCLNIPGCALFQAINDFGRADMLARKQAELYGEIVTHFYEAVNEGGTEILQCFQEHIFQRPSLVARETKR